MWKDPKNIHLTAGRVSCKSENTFYALSCLGANPTSCGACRTIQSVPLKSFYHSWNALEENEEAAVHYAALKGDNYWTSCFALSWLLCPALDALSYPECKTQTLLVLGSRTLDWELEDLWFGFTENYF